MESDISGLLDLPELKISQLLYLLIYLPYSRHPNIDHSKKTEKEQYYCLTSKSFLV